MYVKKRNTVKANHEGLTVLPIVIISVENKGFLFI